MIFFSCKYLKVSQKDKSDFFVNTDFLNKILIKSKTINYQDLKNSVPKEKGIYFWTKRKKLDYIGIALNKNGLYGRIVLQHLNKKYLEYRETKHTLKDKFQLSHSINRKSKDGLIIKKGIDKSTFRKKIGRRYNLKPGSETVSYIKNKGTIKIYELKNIKEENINLIESILISFFKPNFNDSKKNLILEETNHVFPVIKTRSLI